MLDFALGPDTVDLVKRQTVDDEFDAFGRPERTESFIPKAKCSVTVGDATEEVAGTTIAVLKARAALVVDADTEGLAAVDALRFRGRTYELQGPGVRHDFDDGTPSHVRAIGLYADDVSLGELVVHIRAGGRRDDGTIAADGAPTDLIARAVVQGNATRRFGGTGEELAADYTVVLDVDADVRDGDWLIVRGRDTRVVIGRQESEWAARRQLVVLAQYRAGA